ncbi:peptidoglycan DD-metalloendopeptidase family protein [Patescibacteria group bacterium]|nr:peptidoglycan DD-metalloendopeptidase family protein [Patescibacteria group bacterium]
MKRRHQWLVDRLSLSSVAGTVLALVLFMPGLQTLTFQAQIERKLLAEESLDQNSHDILVQNNIAVTDSLGSNTRAEIVKYVIQPGDTLYDIGKRFNVTAGSLAYINSLDNENYLSPGDVIKVPPVTGIVHKVQQGDTVSLIAQKWGAPEQSIVDANWLDAPYILVVDQELVVPRADMPTRTASLASESQRPDSSQASGLQLLSVNADATGTMMSPSVGRLTQYFSWYHPAIDIADRCGGPIVAADSGKIIFADWWAGGGGYTVMVNHGNGYVTKYAHLSSFAKRSGSVSKGEVIGYMGATGRAYGCHVHYIVEYNGRAVNPLSL